MSQEHKTTPLTIEEIRALLEEGKKAREEIEARLKKMHELRCTCCEGQCIIHDKAK